MGYTFEGPKCLHQCLGRLGKGNTVSQMGGGCYLGGGEDLETLKGAGVSLAFKGTAGDAKPLTLPGTLPQKGGFSCSKEPLASPDRNTVQCLGPTSQEAIRHQIKVISSGLPVSFKSSTPL